MLAAGSRWAAVVGWFLVMTLALPVGSPAQIPKRFQNLQVLSKKIERKELVRTMRGWTGALGVRCTYCHVGPDNLEGMNFASDEKREKRVAREMLRMSQRITKSIGALPAGNAPSEEVTCYTCHRGMSRPPQDIRELLTATEKTHGVSAALERYRELRKEHFGTGHYDFSASALNNTARRLQEAGRVEPARAVLELNLQYYPDTASVHSAFGLLYLTSGDKEKARAAFTKALGLDPADPMARSGLEDLDPKQP